jgi:hypothetical protein
MPVGIEDAVATKSKGLMDLKVKNNRCHEPSPSRGFPMFRGHSSGGRDEVYS